MHWTGDSKAEVRDCEPRGIASIAINSALGEDRVSVRTGARPLPYFRVVTRFTPAAPTVLPFVPRDLFPFDANDDPIGAVGGVDVVRREISAGLLYFHIDDPERGHRLLFPESDRAQRSCRATGTTPEDSAGGIWPELGLLLPTPDLLEEKDAKPLAAGKEVTLSDATLLFRPDAPRDERDRARHFLQMLGGAFHLLDLPVTEYRDRVARAQATLRDLDSAPAATIRHYGHRYIHPYTAAEYPDVMVQASLPGDPRIGTMDG